MTGLQDHRESRRPAGTEARTFAAVGPSGAGRSSWKRDCEGNDQRTVTDARRSARASFPCCSPPGAKTELRVCQRAEHVALTSDCTECNFQHKDSLIAGNQTISRIMPGKILIRHLAGGLRLYCATKELPRTRTPLMCKRPAHLAVRELLTVVRR